MTSDSKEHTTRRALFLFVLLFHIIMQDEENPKDVIFSC